MLTRLKVSGFKNLVDVDVRFGPFTCIAGANGVGKSNLFDAIRFLSALADKPIIEAALTVRNEEARTADIRSLFHRVGERYATRMEFEVEMIIPAEGVDDFGQPAKATITFLRYLIEFEFRDHDTQGTSGELEIVKEELTHIRKGDAHKSLLFPHALKWRKSAVIGARHAPYFISTGPQSEGGAVIKLHQDGGSSGKPLQRLASKLPRTVLSAANAAESPTALLARREMQSWRLLQLEPSALRQPDRFTANPHLSSDGSHLPATISRLAYSSNGSSVNGRVFAEIANRLAGLIEDIRELRVDRDDKRELLSIQILDAAGTWHPARALSDGTLRFLALAVISLDPMSRGLLCLEEPENGIHPERVPAILNLLQNISVDVSEEIGEANPMRQVIINTHSPSVVQQVPAESLLLALPEECLQNKHRFSRLSFSCLSNTWRQTRGDNSDGLKAVAIGKLLAYLNPAGPIDSPRDSSKKRDRVVDRDEIRQYLLFENETE